METNETTTEKHRFLTNKQATSPAEQMQSKKEERKKNQTGKTISTSEHILCVLYQKLNSPLSLKKTKKQITYMCKYIDKDEDQENQGVSACSEILDIQMQADGSLCAAFFFWWMYYLKINITVNDRHAGFTSSRAKFSHFCPLVTK